MSIRERHIEFVKDVVTLTGLSASKIASNAGMANTTITRFIKSEQHKELTQKTLDKIAIVAGFESYEEYVFKKRYGGVGREGSAEISDALKFEIYESSKRLLEKKYGVVDPDKVAVISYEIIELMKKIQTDFVTDSLVMYAIEKNSKPSE